MKNSNSCESHNRNALAGKALIEKWKNIVEDYSSLLVKRSSSHSLDDNYELESTKEDSKEKFTIQLFVVAENLHFAPFPCGSTLSS